MTEKSASEQTSLNLGCGPDIREQYWNVDLVDGPGVDQQHDLDEYPWPFETDQFSIVLMSHVIEHLQDREAALNELHRIMRPGGIATVRFPHHNSISAYTDPSHVKTITHRTPNNRVVDHLFEIKETNPKRIRFGRLLPSGLALFAAQHIGNIVCEVELVLEAKA